MVRSKKPSKRITTAKRAKITRKVREHHRKSKKQPKGHRSRKDPGIPASLPFREQIIEEVEQYKKNKLIDKKEKKFGKKNAAVSDLAAYSSDAMMRSEEFEENGNEHVGLFTLPDNSRRAYFKEFKRVVELSDVILVVLDARDPQGSRIALVEEMIREGVGSGTPKRLVLVINKTDLIPTEVTEKWTRYLRTEYPTISLSSTKSSKSEYTPRSLVQLLKNYCRNKNIKTKITVGVIGYPNVGKSSLINALKRGAEACRVGSVPGITQNIQIVQLDRTIQLLDSPGIVFSETVDSKALLLRNCLRVEQISDPVDVVSLIYEKCSKDLLSSIYEVVSDTYSDSVSFVYVIAKKFGRLGKGGVLDINSASRKIISDWNNGKIPFYTLPPSLPSFSLDCASISNEWAREFSLDSLTPDTPMDSEQ